MLPKHLTCSDNLLDALEEIARVNIGKNCVWAIVHLSNSNSNRGRFWATHSTENVVQVIGGAIKDRLSDLDFHSRRAINEKIAEYVGPQGLAHTVGHAEELIIMAWDYMITYHALAYNGETPDTAVLYLSDSPCTIHDGSKKSNNIPNMPASCLAKLNLLRECKKKTIPNWTVFYRKPWGILQQKKQGKLSIDDWNNIKTGQALIRDDPCYSQFTDEMEKMAIEAKL